MKTETVPRNWNSIFDGFIGLMSVLCFWLIFISLLMSFPEQAFFIIIAFLIIGKLWN